MPALDDLKAAGFSDDEVNKFATEKRQTLMAGGFESREVDDYLGRSSEPDTQAANKSFARVVGGSLNRARAKLAETQPAPTEERQEQPGDAATSGDKLRAFGGKTLQTVADVGTLYGPLEAMLNVGTGILFGFPASIVGAIAGLSNKYVMNGKADPAEISAVAQKIFTYHPWSAAGQRLSGNINQPFEWIAEGAQAAGHAVADVGMKHDMPNVAAAAGAVTDSTIQMLAPMLLMGMARKMSNVVPTAQDFHDAAKVAAAEATGEPAAPKAHADAGLGETPAPKTAPADIVQNVHDSLRETYDKTGIDPYTVMEAAKTDPTIIEDLAAPGAAIPRAVMDQVTDGHPEKMSPAYADVLADLETANHGTPEYRENAALLNHAFFDSMSKRTGVPLAELWEKYRPTITTEAPLPAAALQQQRPVAQIQEAVNAEHPKVNVSLTEHESGLMEINTFELRDMKADEGRGYGPEAMKAITAEADAAGRDIMLSATPAKGSRRSLDDLVGFYEKNGFYLADEQPWANARIMFRDAKPRETQAEARAPGPAGEEPRGAGGLQAPQGEAGKNQGPQPPLGTLYQSGTEPRSWYYSELGRQVEAKGPNAATAEQWLGTLKKLKGVKPDEIKWSGIEEWLALQDGKVTKTQVNEFLKNNGVQVQEVTLGGKGQPSVADAAIAVDVRAARAAGFTVEVNPEDPATIAFMDRQEGDLWTAGDIESEFLPRDEVTADAVAAMHRIERHWQAASLPEADAAKFGNYQLPGGKNYRELLLTLPTTDKAPTLRTGYRVMEMDHGRWTLEGPTGEGTLLNELTPGASREEAQAAAVLRMDRIGVGRPGTFQSSHFDQPNILAHVRFNDRVDAEGKQVLFVEELQSDWAQQGKKEGFGSQLRPLSEAEQAEWRKLRDRYVAGRLETGEENARFIELDQQMTKSDRGIPSAPFVGKTDAWVSLAVKRMIAYAAEHGYDRIAWANGEQQAARYDLSKHVKEIKYAKMLDGDGYYIQADTHQGVTVFDETNVDAKRLEDFVGKEIAKKIVETATDEEQYLRGLDLKVGGEGMKAFYDKIVPNVVNDVLKKLGGGKLREVEIHDTYDDAFEYRGASDGTYYILDQNGIRVEEGFPTIGDVERRIDVLHKEHPPSLKQPGFDITPAMREKVTGGLPLFQGSDHGNRGYMQIGPKGERIIGLLAEADPSTYVHESGHFFLDVINDIARGADAPAEIKRDVQRLYDWFGIKDADQWNTMSLQEQRPYHERFARGFEQFLAEGKAPTPALKSVFERFKAWLLEVYQSLEKLGVKLNDQTRGVMERMLSGEPIADLRHPEADPWETEPQPAARSAAPPAMTQGIDSEDMRSMLQNMAQYESGWAQIGGKLDTGRLAAEGVGLDEQGRPLKLGTPAFTEWIPIAEWWPGKPKGATVAKVRGAVDKALEGRPLGALEQRIVDYMVQVANERLAAQNDMGGDRWNDVAREISAEGLTPTTENVIDADLVARAVEKDADAVERLAVEHQDNDVAFMDAIRSMTHGEEGTEARGGAASGREGARAVEPNAAESAAAAGHEGGSERASDADAAQAADVETPQDVPAGYAPPIGKGGKLETPAPAEVNRVADLLKAVRDPAQEVQDIVDLNIGLTPRDLAATPRTGTLYQAARPNLATAARDLIARAKATWLGSAAYDWTRAVWNDIQIGATPMSAGSDRARAIAKDYANAERVSRYQWGRFDKILEENYSKEQREAMWDAADEENILRTLNVPKADRTGRGLDRLDAGQRTTMDTLQHYGEQLLQRARDVGMFKGEGVAYWAPRMVAMIDETGHVTAPKGEAGSTPYASPSGHNVTTSAPSLKHRKYLTVEETEAAARLKLGDEANVVHDVRTMPLAMARIERAIAGRELINGIKDIGKKTAQELVVDGEAPEYFTLDHPAFKTTKPRFVEVDGKMQTITDQNGDMVFDRVPLYVSKEFEGPLKSIMSDDSGALYKSLMALKGKTMGVIMYSPLIHNAVEWGRALPALPGKVLTFRVYFEGNEFKNQPENMVRAIQNGMVPIGRRGQFQDISGIAEEPNLTPGRSWTAQLLGGATGIVNKAAGEAVKHGIDIAGDFWHNTLLWDRIGDLQAGLYKNIEADLIKRGMEPTTAGRVAAHFANRYAGALPNEAMSTAVRKTANFVLFSRSFTMGNLGVMKDMFTGLPPDVAAQITRDAGTAAAYAAKGVAQRKAIQAFAMDIALMYGANAALQNALDAIKRDKTAKEIEREYAERLSAMFNRTKESPVELLNPLGLLDQLSPLSENEPGKEQRILYDYDDQGTGIYVRVPTGKIGEEFVDWGTSPLAILKRKEGTIMRPIIQTLTNDKGFGRKVYDDQTPGFKAAAKAVGDVLMNFVSQQFPTDSVQSAVKMAKGEAEDIDALKVVGPLFGVTFSKGAPGGPEVGELFRAEQRHRNEVNTIMPAVKELLKRDKMPDAIEKMRGANMTPSEIRTTLRLAAIPKSRLTRQRLKQFYGAALPEERERMERARNRNQPQEGDQE